MSYYNRDCKRLSINKKNMDYLKMGGCANIWHDSNIVFKEYFCDTVPVLRLSGEMFDFLKTINDPHFIELYDIYSKMSLLKLFKYKRDSQFFTVDAYTAKYYPDNSVNVLTAPVDYILDNFRELDILFDIFTKHQVVTCDIKRENSILSHDGIVIIDPDLFAKTIQGIPLGRFADPEEDIGRVCVFLASEDASYVTGETITLQGGSGLRP